MAVSPALLFRFLYDYHRLLYDYHRNGQLWGLYDYRSLWAKIHQVPRTANSFTAGITLHGHLLPFRR